MRFKLYILLFIFLMPSPVLASEGAYSSSGLPLPRFVSLAKDEVFVRSGPGKQYPVNWVLKRNGLPVEIVLEFEHWRKIKDHDGQEGWVYYALLSGKRMALIKGDDPAAAYKKPLNGLTVKPALSVYFEPKSQVELKECQKHSCYVYAQGFSGWVERKSLWGIYEHEIFD